MNLRTRLGFKQNLTIILCVGAIIKRKGIDLLIKSFAKYSNKYSNTILVLIGPTADDKENLQFYNKMKKLANNLNVEKYIVFTGTRDNIDEYMKASDLFVFLSRNEGFGTVLVEAMSAGLPVVALNIPGITKYIIKNRIDGIIIRNKNPDKIALEIEALLNNYDLYESISVNARKSAINRFSTKIIDKQYEQIYDKISQFN
jgi:glycosyltransferase involved in cell wall biosynthesis